MSQLTIADSIIQSDNIFEDRYVNLLSERIAGKFVRLS